VKISLDESSSDDMLKKICDGILDVGIVTPSSSEIQELSDRLEFIFLLDDSTYLICSDELLQKHFGDRSVTVKARALQGTDLHEFADLPFLLHKPPMKLRKTEDESFNKAGFRPKVYIESSNTELMIALYLCHLGAFFSRKSRLRSIRQLYGDCNAFPIRYAGTPHQTTIYFVRRKALHPPAHILEFQRLMQKAWITISES
jgi:DNA-binding transcriptional LysR family regulator